MIFHILSGQLSPLILLLIIPPSGFDLMKVPSQLLLPSVKLITAVDSDSKRNNGGNRRLRSPTRRVGFCGEGMAAPAPPDVALVTGTVR